jgi:CBS domain-containing protein
MRIEEVMTTDVATIGPEATLKDAARLLIGRRISGMPVVDADGHVLGVVSEGDLLFKQRGASERNGGILASLLHRGDDPELAKLDARLVEEAMTSPAITIDAGWSLATAADRMLSNGINRLPVMSQGRLVGIVSRADIVRAFARSDAEVERDVLEQVTLYRALWNEGPNIEAHLVDGTVTLTGETRLRSEAEILPRVLARIPGVVEVSSQLRWSEDDD